ncbi:molybdate ABC transporter substrate-binding protein [Tissierella sp. Yu-01]|uniref:molybdate ABC transporter substrate-binding protein n=1 Tax=Tissierella sp. Yu-01 TaxID=3035694 RepID=UPI00240DBA56|nr:molybdate ABC transporter substrate-binding protein [Tissierella sp. Yu-01]WFA09020.1 molybdate ABC transporter substrate-binding protein [Tissierella sp. Yu-01]
MKEKKLLALLVAVVLSVSLFAGCTSKAPETPGVETSSPDESLVAEEPEKEVELLISAAASMTDVLQEIAENYKVISPTTKLTFTFGSSGALQTQIEEGAPADIFISAAQKQMTALEEKDLIVKESKKTLLVNKVILIAPKDSNLSLTSFEDIIKDEVEKIALGEPTGVPVGQYSEEIFTTLGIWDKVKTKAVYGSDVRTVLTWVETGELDCGVVYATDAYSTDKVKIVAEAPEGSHKEVTYPIAVIKSSSNVQKAQEFLDYLSTDEAVKVFEKYGFSMK